MHQLSYVTARWPWAAGSSSLRQSRFLRRAGPIGLGLLVLLALLLPAQGWAAAFGSVRGTVQDARGRPVSGAIVELESAASRRIMKGRTDAQGRFVFSTVAVGQYRLSVRRHGFRASSQPVTVESGYFPNASILLLSSTSLSKVTVSATRELPPVASVTPITLVSQQDIESTPGAINANSLAMITDYVPGTYEAHDMLHMRGGHQTNWLMDGVEIPNTNIAENLGPAVNPEDVQTLEASGAATRPMRATVPMASSTSSRRPASAAPIRRSSMSPRAISARPTMM